MCSLRYSITPLLHYSVTPLLHYSITPLLHYSPILQLGLKLASISGPYASSGPVLSGQDEDVVSAWVALVMLTLQELGVQGVSGQDDDDEGDVVSAWVALVMLTLQELGVQGVRGLQGWGVEEKRRERSR